MLKIQIYFWCFRVNSSHLNAKPKNNNLENRNKKRRKNVEILRKTVFFLEKSGNIPQKIEKRQS